MNSINNEKYNKPINWFAEDLPINIHPQIRKFYEKNYIICRKEYSNWVDKESKNYKENIDWWVTSFASRNPYISKILNYITILKTLNQIKKIKKKINLFTESESFAEVIKIKNIKNIKVCLIKKKIIFVVVKQLIKSILFQITFFILINFIIKKKKPSYNKIIIIDTFLTLNKKQNLNFYKPFSFKKEKKILIAPTIVPTLNFFKLFKIISKLVKKNDNYIFKEHYWTFVDLIYSFLHVFRRQKLFKKKYKFEQYNLSNLIAEENFYYDNFFSTNYGILNYIFFKRAREKKINFIKSINWFENQPIDRGWNLGFRKFYTKSELNSYGVQDFSKHYNLISNSPTYIENKFKVTPEKVLIISSIFKKITKEFFSKQKVNIVQSWRFKKPKIDYKSKYKKKILLILCGIKEIDKKLLNIIFEACRSQPKLRVFIKPHPILQLNNILKENIPKNAIVTKKNLKKILPKTLITITSGPSSAIYESIQFKNFIILVNIEAGTKENAKVFNLKKNNFKIIDSSKQLLIELKKLKKF